jgi:cysteine-S-conjugate beta-lyase
MEYDFDDLIDRRGTGSLKWDYLEMVNDNEIIPMWVADMDFKAPKEVVDALIERAEHGIFGYTPVPDSYYREVIEWIRKRHGWELEKEWIATTPGVLPAVVIAIQAFTEPGDGILIQPPVYHPFRKIIQDNERLPVDSPLSLINGEYRMDYANFEKQAKNGVRMMVLCSPHNPVGRVWKRDELEKLAEICIDNNILILSDEIHFDLIMKGYEHVPMASLSREIAEHTITFTSASKTFNLPGLSCANAIISNKKLLDRFNHIRGSLCIGMPNIFGLVAAETAYKHGAEWLEQLLEHIEKNYEYLASFIEKNIPEIGVSRLEGTYLAWLDFRELGLPDEELDTLLLREAKIWLDNGPKFGKGGEGFQRLNLACQRETLEKGLKRLASAVATNVERAS